MPAAIDKPWSEKSFTLFSDQKLLDIYAAMLRCRMLEERVSLYRKEDAGRGMADSASGHEAAKAGTLVDLVAGDSVFSFRGDAAADLLQDKPLDAVLRRAIADAGSEQAATEFADRLHMATGVALANRTRGKGEIAVVFAAVDSSSVDCLRDAMKVAGAHSLPIIFECWEGSAAAPVPNVVKGLSIPAIAADEDDAVAIYRVATESITHARKGNGPTLIDCRPYRLKGSPGAATTGPEPANAGDSIRKMERYMTAKGLFCEELRLKIADGIRTELDAASQRIGIPGCK